MAVSAAYLIFFSAASLYTLGAAGVLMVGGILYVCTRPTLA